MAELQIPNQNTLATQDEFAPFEEQAKEWMDKAQQITVTDVTQTGLMKEARTARLALRDIRIGVDKKHKELKEEYLRKGQALDKIKNRLIGLISPIEKHLQAQEDFAEHLLQQQEQELTERRIAQLTPYMGPDARLIQVSAMSQAAFDLFLGNQKIAFEQREKTQKEEAERRQAEVKAKAEEEERIRQENERLRKENEAKAAELKRIQDAENARLAQVAAENKAKAAAERKAKRAPDKEKILLFTQELAALAERMPDVKTSEASELIGEAKALIRGVVSAISKKAEAL